MKMFRTVLMTSALAVTALVPAFAQADAMRVTVPFPFLVGNQKMAAGQYDVQSEMTNGVVLLQGEGHGIAVITSPFSVTDSDDKPSLIFVNTEDGPRLVRVHLAGEPARSIPVPAQVRMKLAVAR